MKSMTGFGSGKSSSQETDLDINVKSVNGRFLEIRLHGPKEYASSEGAIRSLIKSQLFRGTVDVYISRKMQDAASGGELKVNWNFADQLHEKFLEIKEKYGLDAEVDLAHFLRHQEVISLEESSEVSTQETEQLMGTVDAAVKSLLKERVREGKVLQKELAGLLKTLGEIVKGMAATRKQAINEIRQRLEAKLEQIQEKFQGDANRIAQEVAIAIDKSDINEEISRLTEHIKTFKNLIKADGPLGKKLDFYIQEMLRETNTVGSKSQNKALTDLVVEAKSIVEKIREQVQNIE